MSGEIKVTWLHQTDYRQLRGDDTPEALLAREYGDKHVVGWGVTELAEGMTHLWVRWEPVANPSGRGA